MEAIKFIESKLDEVIEQIATYEVKAKNERLEVWEEVTLDNLKKELEHFTAALSSLKVLQKMLKPKAA
jgi:hypothetical protein